MLLLTSVNDRLQLITDAAIAIDVHTTWVDTVTSSGTITPGRTNSAITTAATTNIVGGPAASTQRNVKTVHIRNKGASPCGVTVQHTDGTVVAQLFKTSLIASGQLQYTDQGGFTVLS
jgi:hypothetical protein